MKETRICKECGLEFETSHPKKSYCGRPHYRTCKICGSKFLVPWNKLSSDISTCSEKCRRKAISLSGKQREKKFKHICSICGKEFYAVNQSARVCDRDHVIRCAVCGKEFHPSHEQLISGVRTCSPECRYELSTRTYKENLQDNRENYRAAMISKYGVDNPMKLRACVDKSKQTCIEKYGQTSFSKTDNFIIKCKETNQKKYGVDWYANTEECRRRTERTCLKKYGVDNPSKSKDIILDRISDPSKIQTLMEFRDSPKEFIHRYFTHPPTLRELSDTCGIRESSAGDIVAKAGCKKEVAMSFSSMEEELYKFLLSLVSEDEIERNTFQVITPYELDIYLPNYRFAIECDPTVTHNSSLPGFGPSDSPKSRGYHKMKTDLCESKRIDLFHIFGYDWSCHKDVIKSMIANRLGKSQNKLYARNLIIKEVTDKDACWFLDQNHRQGKAHSKVRIGLHDNETLVSLMTFSKMRKTIGTGLDDTHDCWELVRFCSKINVNVVGGAGKLFKHFVNLYQPQKIRSFSDRAHTSGKLYTILGFHEIRRSDPGYVWVNLKTDVAYSRVNAQKRNIKKFLHDNDIDISRTETEIMIDHKFVQVFDSGTITWEYRRGE